jgi:hypothetical protein
MILSTKQTNMKSLCMNSFLFIPYFPIIILNYPSLLCSGQKCVVGGHLIYSENPFAKKNLNLYVENINFEEAKYE